MELHRFWIRFEDGDERHLPRPGCGVTAYTYSDALAILSGTVFKGMTIAAVEDVIEDVDVSALDQKHVLPNMESPTWRGVWYPRGFSY